MRWCFLIAVTLGLSVMDAVSFAQQQGLGQGEAERLAATRRGSGYPEPRDAGYFASTGVVRFQLIQGRLRLESSRHRKGSQNRDQDGIYESIAVTAVRGIPSVQYVCNTQHQQLTLSVSDATQLRIESFLPETNERAILEQPESGPINWTVRRGDLLDEHHGATLLHINQADAVGFELHCGQIIQRLLQGTSLGSLQAATTRAMIRQIENGDATVIDRERVAVCIEKLGASRRSLRVIASQELLRYGSPVIPILHSFSADQMSLEQQQRLEAILERFKSMESDTPASLAMLLVNDDQHWHGVASKLNRDQMALANQHLQRNGLTMMPEPVESIERIAQGSSPR